MIGHCLSSDNEMYFSIKIQTFSRTKHNLNFILECDMTRHVGFSSHRSVNFGYEMSFLLSIYRAGLTQTAFGLYRAAPSPTIDDLRYLGGARTLLGRERSA